MTIRRRNPWEDIHSISGFVLLPKTRNTLRASCAGPTRRAEAPLLIFFTGAGAPVAVYIKVQEKLSQYARTLFYDRAGYNLSTVAEGVSSITAQSTAEELGELLQTLDLKPPYLLVGHSYGGVLAWEFLHHAVTHLRTAAASSPSEEVVCGMVLLDTPSELTFTTFPRIPSADLVAVSRGVDYAAATNLKVESGMTDEEWHNAISGCERSIFGSSKEDTHGSAYTLARRKQLEGNAFNGGVLAVVRLNSTKDYQLMYDEGVKLGSGSDDERDNARRFIEQWGLFNHQLTRAQMDLVGDQYEDDKMYAYLGDWGHDGPLRNPDLAADPVRWVLNRIQMRRTSR